MFAMGAAFFNASRVSPTTWDPANTGTGATLSSGNLIITKTSGSGSYSTTRTTTSYSSGKYYFEVKVTETNTSNYMMVGIINSSASLSQAVGTNINGYGYYEQNGDSYYNNVATAFGSAWGLGDVIGVAVDLTAGKIWFAKNNTWQASGSPSTGANPAYSITAGGYYAACSVWSTTSPADELTGQFRAAAQTYAPPAGFASWGS